jgi:hypothetical protein
MGAFDSFYGYDTKDPLGIDRGIRGMNNRFNFQQQNPGNAFGPLPSMQWEGFFQGLQDRGVSKVGDSSTRRGFGPQFGALPSTYNPDFQVSASESMPSNQIGVPGEEAPLGVYGSSIPSMDSLSRSTGGYFGIEHRAQGRGRRFQKVVGQRGTSGSNQSERG